MAALPEYGPKVSDYRIDIKSEPLAEYLNTCKAWLDTQSDMQFGGMVFFPVTADYENPTVLGERVFHTVGLKLKVAVWDSLVDPQRLAFCPDELDVYTNNTALLATPPPSTLQVFDQQWDIVYTDLILFNKITGLMPGLPPNTPGAAREYDLVFLEFSKFCELASIIVNPNYDPGSADSRYFIVTDEPGNYFFNMTPVPTADQRGIQVSRSSFDFDYSYLPPATAGGPAPARVYVNMGKARTLKFNPYPEPVLPDYESRAAVAYQTGVPCPPIWQNGALSHAVRLALSTALKEGTALPLSEGFGPPTQPPALPTSPRDSSFAELYQSNALVRWLVYLFILLAALLLYVLLKKA